MLKKIALALLVASGCSTLPQTKVDLKEIDLSEHPIAVINDVPFVEQTQKLCGPTALYMATKKVRPDLALDEVTRITFTPAALGAFKQDMLAGARRLGMAPYKVETIPDLFAFSAEGYPIVVFHNTRALWKRYWHYSVLTGYNRLTEKFNLHIGPIPHYEVTISDLVTSWTEGGRWSYVIVAPEKLPPKANLEEALDNALAFLRLGLNDEAYNLSEKIAARWPNRYEADIVFAEAMLRRNMRREALASLRKASRKKPENLDLKRKVIELAKVL